MYPRIKQYSLVIFLAASLVALPLAQAVAAAAGGALAGTVTDQRGAVVVGATVTALDASGATSRASVKTGADGKFKIEALPAGEYVIVVSSPGFAEARRAAVRVEEGKTVELDFRLEVLSVETTVEVKASGMKPNTDPIYRALRDAQDFTAAAYSVSGLALKRDAGVFTLSGEIYFLPPVEGRTVAAVFIGGGELSLTPPTEAERQSLALFSDSPTLAEPFSTLVLRFTDKTFDEVKSSPRAKPLPEAPQAARAKEIYKDSLSLVRREANRFGIDMRYNYEVRTLIDLYSPEREGFFTAFITGNRFKKLVYRVDPLGVGILAPEEVALASYGQNDYGFWTAFHHEAEYANGGQPTGAEENRLYNIVHHEIDGAIKGTQLAATDRITLRPMQRGVRVVPFNLYRSLRVGRVQDEAGNDLQFIQESKDEDADFAVILPEEMRLGKTYKITVQYAGGDAIRDSGGDNYFLLPRSTWYPNNPNTQFGDRAAFDMTFRYPKGNTFIGVGSRVGEDAREGDLMVTRWSSGQTELAVAGFNYGRFKKKEVADKDTGYNVEFYANDEVPNALKLYARNAAVSTTAMAGNVMADAQNATRIYDFYFGKLPYTRIAMSQQPAGNFGQAWPTLVFMPFTAYLDTTTRVALMDTEMGTNDFWEFVGPHEVAHQWWGHVVGWKSYRDQWMSEGFAEFSTSIYAQFVEKDIDKFIKFWEKQRVEIMQEYPWTRGRKPYTVGAVTQGFRLNGAKTGGVYQSLVYPKGAYILHMLRMMMYEQGKGDERFIAMMKDFVKANYNKDVTTEDFKAAVERHMSDDMNLDGNRRMDWFFRQWVYGTEVPSYKFEYTISGDTLSGRITQSGVSNDFAMLVPVYLDFGNGDWWQLGKATIRGNETVELGQVKLPKTPKRAAISAYKDVLAVSTETVKK